MAQPFGRPSFEEQQTCETWLNVLLAAVAFASIGGMIIVDAMVKASPSASHTVTNITVIDVVIFAVVATMLFMRTRVDDAALSVSFGWLFPYYRRRIPLKEIASADVITYSPIREYGGWGIKWGNGGVALNMRGNRGVQLVLQNGARILIGSQRPEELLAALTKEETSGNSPLLHGG